MERFTRRQRANIAGRGAPSAHPTLEPDAADGFIRASFHDSPTGMVVLDSAGVITQVNDAFASMVGVAPDQLVGRAARGMVHPDDGDRVADAFRHLVRRRHLAQPAMAQHRIVDDAGRVRWVSTRLARVGRTRTKGYTVLAHVIDTTEHRALLARVRHLEGHDPATGLLSRRGFDRALTEHVHLVSHRAPIGAVLVVDLDNFVYVNGALGTRRGDALLGRVAHALRARLRPHDVLARLGGDEFAVLLPDADASTARDLADSLLAVVREVPLEAADHSASVQLTASIGIAMLDGSLPTSDAVLLAADLAMHDAKADGRNRWAIAPADTPAASRTMSKVAWLERIRSALDEGGLRLYAQPIMHLPTGSSTQCELLLRIQADDGTVVLPGELLAMAEHLDLVQRIDRWVTDAAIEYLRTTPGVTVEVNLSGATLGDATLLEAVQRRLHDTAVDPRRLVFEITETAAIANITEAHHFATTLARIGCRFALDDFGAGFGSFYYVKHLPFDFVKIDGEFIANATKNPTDQAIIRSIVGIAAELGKSTIAEHTHDEATLTLLRDLGVEYAQGFHIGRPTPLASWVPRTAPGIGEHYGA